MAGGEVVDGEEQSQGKTQKAATKTGTVSSLSFPFLSLLPQNSPHTHTGREDQKQDWGKHEGLEKNIK